MKRILVVADLPGQTQHTIRRAVKLAERLGARLDIVGFVYEHLANLPTALNDKQIEALKKKLVRKHRDALRQATDKAIGSRKVRARIEVLWEKRVGDWINNKLKEQPYDLVMKGAHRTETAIYTPTDWQVLRGSNTPVLLFAEKRWKRGTHVMAAVDLGTKARGKMQLNYKVVEQARTLAQALRCELHVGYAVPFSVVLRDLDVIDKSAIQEEGKRRAEKFRASLAKRGIEIDGIHVATGAPGKVLVSLAAKNHARMVVLGCVGRKRLSGRIIGNTAEKILRLLKADVLAVKP